MLLVVVSAAIGLTLFFTAMIAFAAGAFWLKKKRDAQRRAELQELAQSLGFSFFEKDSFSLDSQLKSFDLFRRERLPWSRRRKITNVMRGQVGETDVFLFDYSYIVSTGKSAREVRQTVLFANDKNWSLPNFRLKPENWWHKVLSKVGVKKDINFPDDPDFSNRFWLTGEIEGLIRQKFSPDLQRFLTERPSVHLEGSNYYLIAYKPGKALNADEARGFFEHCCQLIKLLREKENPELLNLAELKREARPEELEAPDLPEKEVR